VAFSRYVLGTVQACTLLGFLVGPATAVGTAEEEISVIVAPSVPHNWRNSEAAVLELEHGELLLAWTDFYGPDEDEEDATPARISAAISKDGGRTWSARFTLQENIGNQNVMSPNLLRLQSSKILLFFLRKNSSDDCFPLFRLSTDGAKTFSPPKPIPIIPSPSYTGFNNDRAVQLRSGRILVPMFFESKATGQARILSRVYFSDDEGETWAPSETIVDVKQSTIGAQEPGVVELNDGRIMMWLRTSTGKIHTAYSSDSGLTWGATEVTDVASPPSPASIKRIPRTGDLLMVWNNAPWGRFPLAAGISKDDGKTWEHVQNLEAEPRCTYAYTSITFVEDRALLTYYVDRGLPKKPGGRPNAGGSNWSLKFKSLPVESLYSH
jgi:sialidase-1